VRPQIAFAEADSHASRLCHPHSLYGAGTGKDIRDGHHVLEVWVGDDAVVASRLVLQSGAGCRACRSDATLLMQP
jgi:hypothetical protein